MDRALLVGINSYPGAPLAGCLNDVTDMATFLIGQRGFPAESIRLLTDSRATTAAILERLQWLLDGLAPGDRVLFHYSGHGTQIALRDESGTVDRMDDAICPVDFDWSEQHMISGVQFKRIFSSVPKGVEFVWISDSCHSGALDRVAPGSGAPSVARQRFLAPPADLAWRADLRIGKEDLASGLRPGYRWTEPRARVGLQVGPDGSGREIRRPGEWSAHLLPVAGSEPIRVAEEAVDLRRVRTCGPR